MPGGDFPFPPAVADLCQMMPPPNAFHGPFVIVDRLMEVFAKVQLPDQFYGRSVEKSLSSRTNS
jgi:cleavage stimulation factor subunit 3